MRGKRADTHKSLAHAARYELSQMARYGESKHQAKEDAHGGRLDGIYSIETMKAYQRNASYFADWAEQQGAHTLEDAKDMIVPYLQEQIDQEKSAWTIHARAAALSKLYGMSCADLVDLPQRTRADVERSRGDAVRDAHFSEERNADLVNFCQCTGLRRHELEALRGTDLDEREGRYYVHVEQGKGGKERYAPVVGTQEQVDRVVELMRERAEDRVFERVHNAADIHGYRGDYAERLYNEYARPIEQIPPQEQYHMRGDRKGETLDKYAMKVTSEALGHERINVIAGHYLHGGR